MPKDPLTVHTGKVHVYWFIELEDASKCGIVLSPCVSTNINVDKQLILIFCGFVIQCVVCLI